MFKLGLNCNLTTCVYGNCVPISGVYSFCQCPSQYEGEFCQYGFTDYKLIALDY